jgi:hypothetical protein
VDSLRDEKFFSVGKLAANALESTKIKSTDTLEGVAFYSQVSINREWEILRSQWYQNNIQFKPKFRKISIYISKVDTTPQTSSSGATGTGVTSVQQPNISFKNLSDSR